MNYLILLRLALRASLAVLLSVVAFVYALGQVEGVSSDLDLITALVIGTAFAGYLFAVIGDIKWEK